MSQGFNFRYNQMKENLSNSKEEMEMEVFPSYSNVRNICFTQENGRSLFLNYGYLVAGDYIPEERKIILTFTSHWVVLEGINLQFLFEDLQLNIPKKIVVADKRYNATVDTNRPAVNSITITQSNTP